MFNDDNSPGPESRPSHDSEDPLALAFEDFFAAIKKSDARLAASVFRDLLDIATPADEESPASDPREREIDRLVRGATNRSRG